MATLQAARAYVLLSREGFFKEVYRPKRDELAEKWTEMSQRRF